MAPEEIAEQKIDVEAEIEDAVKSGQFPDRNSAIIGLMKQLIDYQKGALKGKIKGSPVNGVEKYREEKWKALIESARGDEDRAVQMYIDELKKLNI
ncbi:hypothetical protein CUJ83_06890 [Methanocella sp. CWC-04]|uniref:Uncharacterized protein n=1 Tax=Methanooceanicella nereidis TaxID=2052831 RepID=A0AAP2RC22_9EURY|nr:hypothetical protein [Methanocella sp. CWC-04]MCD1294723.1 hypothetical protein [Methanocella sp. CWC-04]